MNETNSSSPVAPVAPATSTEENKRGWLLSGWLGLMFVSNIAAVLFYFFGQSLMAKAYPGAPSWVLIAYSLLGVVNVVWAVSLFKWKMWGFYGVIASTVVALVLNLYMGIGAKAFLGLIGPAILYFVMRPKWQLFK